MSIDLTKLTPAPWSTGGTFMPGSPAEQQWVWGPRVKHTDQSGTVVAERVKPTNAAFIALARNAFDVMMRRGWYACRVSVGTQTGDVEKYRLSKDFRYIIENEDWWLASQKWYDDPFTALVEADKWYRDHIEAKGSEQ